MLRIFHRHGKGGERKWACIWSKLWLNRRRRYKWKCSGISLGAKEDIYISKDEVWYRRKGPNRGRIIRRLRRILPSDKEWNSIERFKFFTRNQEPEKTFEKFLTELKLLASSCNFADLEDSLLRDRVVCGILDSNMRERLLKYANLHLNKCLQICRAAEFSKSRVRDLE